MNKRVLVIVVSYNGKKWLERCLTSVCAVGGSNGIPLTEKTAQNAPGGQISEPLTAVSVGLYVWDNDSTDGSADFVAAHYPAAKLVRSAENLGFSRPNNMGVEYAIKNGYDYVYFLNQDAWLEEGALETLVAAAEAHPDYAVISPLQMTDGYTTLDHNFAKCLPAASSTKMARLVLECPQNDGSSTKTAQSVLEGAENGSPRTNTAHLVLEGGGSEVLEVKRIMAAHWLAPVRAWQRVGPFNEELFPLYGQDDDWCNRARFCGLKIGVVPAARAVHDRAYRKESIERLVNRNYYTGSLVRLADPDRSWFITMQYVFLFTLVKAVKYRSLLPFKYLHTIWRQLPSVKASRIRAIHAR